MYKFQKKFCTIQIFTKLYIYMCKCKYILPELNEKFICQTN